MNKFSNFFIIVVSTVLTVFFIELFFYLNKSLEWLPKKHTEYNLLPVPLSRWNITVNSKEALRYDAINKLQGVSLDNTQISFITGVGPELWPYHTVSKLVLLPDNKFIESVDYRIDQFGRRPVPNHKVNDDKTFLWFQGCSFTYGDGVKEEETFVNIASESLGIKAYNQGWNGGGATVMLKKMQLPEHKFFEGIKEERAIVVYTYIDSHLYRSACPSSCLTNKRDSNYSYSPYYYLKEGKLEGGDKSYAKRYRYSRWIFNILHSSSLVEFLELDFPNWKGQESIDTFIEVMKASREEISKKVILEDYIIAFYPGFSYETTSLIRKRLISEGFSIIDLSPYDFSKNFKAPAVIPFNGHPTPEAHRLYGLILAEEIKKRISHKSFQ